MKQFKRIVTSSIFIMLLSFAILFTVFAVGTKYVYNGNGSSGWSGFG